VIGSWSGDSFDATLLNNWSDGPLRAPRTLKGDLNNKGGELVLSCSLAKPFSRDIDLIEVPVPTLYD
jgi:hypothetical protein